MRLVRAVHVPAHRALLQHQERIEHLVHERMLQRWCGRPHQPPHRLHLRQRLLLRNHSCDEIADLAQRLLVVLLRDREQVPDTTETSLGIRRALVTAATTRTPVARSIRRKLDTEEPLPMPPVPQLRALAAQRLPLSVPARTTPEHRSLRNRHVDPSRLGHHPPGRFLGHRYSRCDPHSGKPEQKRDHRIR
ncbi:hypothetical protein ACFPN7_25275 [Amycolatopsis halotolerans]|uniref:hypothetical protein n=1 Tax=Amycolatopsis halotolerans TaxID=330083 RepID=UPI00361AF7CE